MLCDHELNDGIRLRALRQCANEALHFAEQVMKNNHTRATCMGSFVVEEQHIEKPLGYAHIGPLEKRKFK